MGKRRRKYPDDPATRYALAVGAGDVLAGPHVRAACARHLDDLVEGPKRGLVWDVELATKRCAFFPDVLRLNGERFEGMPFELIDWQGFIVASLFGWLKDDGFRRFRVAYIEAGKGSGKSPLVAGIGLLMLTADGTARAECYAAATKKEQARVLFRDAVAMVEQSPELRFKADGRPRLKLTHGTEEPLNIAYSDKRSFFRPISSEDRGRGQSGPRIHFAALDEIHEHRTPAMVEFTRAGTKSARQSLVTMITNSGFDFQTVCGEQHNYAIKVCNRELENDSYFGYVCALDEDDEPLEDQDCWIKANPSLPLIPGVEYLEEQVREARGMPSKQNIVRRLNFCQWTQSEAAWIGADEWQAIEHEMTDEDWAALVGRRCSAGLDLSSKRDLTALALFFEAEAGEFGLEEDGYLAVVVFWTPKDTLDERALIDVAPYRQWLQAGHLRTTPGKSVSYAHVVKDLDEMQAEWIVEKLRFDRWRIEDFERELTAEGLYFDMEPHGQGFKDMAPAIDTVEGFIDHRKLRVASNPCLRWNAACVVLDEDAAGNRKFAKNKVTGRIDGIQALAMGAVAAAGDPAAQPTDGNLLVVG